MYQTNVVSGFVQFGKLRYKSVVSPGVYCKRIRSLFMCIHYLMVGVYCPMLKGTCSVKPVSRARARGVQRRESEQEHNRSEEHGRRTRRRKL